MALAWLEPVAGQWLADSFVTPHSALLHAGAPLVEADLTEIGTARSAMVPQDVLLYCYYGGMLAAGAAGSASAPLQSGDPECMQLWTCLLHFWTAVLCM